MIGLVEIGKNSRGIGGSGQLVGIKLVSFREAVSTGYYSSPD